MQITNIQIRRTFSEGPMKAVVSVTFDGVFAVHDIKVIHAGEKKFITMPGRMLKDGTYRDAAHPIGSEFRAVLESAVLEAYSAHILEIEKKEGEKI